MKNAVLLLAENRGISTFPAVFQCARELKKAGCRVAVITGSEIDDQNLKEHFDDYVFIKTGDFTHELMSVTKELFKRKSDIVIAFEPGDAKNAVIAARMKRRCKYVYYNLEILDDQYLPASGKMLDRIKFEIFRKMERTYLALCSCMVIQDEIRMELAKKYGLSHANTFLIPNSYNYLSSNNSEIKERDTCSVLYSGSLEKWSVKSLIEHSAKFKQISLTLSGWSRDGFINKYISGAGLVNDIKIDLQRYTFIDYIEIVKKHDIGLVWYSGKTDNIRHIGRSSGKYFMYLSCGKPVIVQNLPGIADDVNKYKLGVVIESLDELKEAVDHIKQNYSIYCDNIAKYYPLLYAYDAISRPFIDFITSDR
jgi:glycosyltransferase involved in cell wall biosynthesis